VELLAGALFLPAYKKKVSMKDKEYITTDGEFLGESAKND